MIRHLKAMIGLINKHFEITIYFKDVHGINHTPLIRGGGIVRRFFSTLRMILKRTNTDFSRLQRNPWPGKD